METAFNLGTIEVRWYSILIITAIVAGILLAIFEARRRGENADHILSLAAISIPLGIIGARLYHVIHRWDSYSSDPLSIFGGQGLGIFGGVIGGFVGLIIYCKWKGLSILRWLDIGVPSLILAQAIGRWGNFFNHELYGRPTDLPWGFYLDPAYRLPEFEAYDHFHPLFLYESAWNFLGLFVLLFLGRKLAHRLLDGDILFGYIIWYCSARFFLEGLKPDVWTIAGVPTARWIAGIAIIASIAVIAYRRYRLRSVA